MGNQTNENIEKLSNFLNPEILKENLISLSLYVANFEALKAYIIEQPKSLFEIGFDENGILLDEKRYNEKVKSKDENILKASLFWWIEQGALEQKDFIDFYNLRSIRNSIVHEMFNHLFNGINEFTSSFEDLLEIKVKLDRWWTINIEIPTNPDIEDVSKINLAEVITSSEILLILFSYTLSNDEEKSKYFYNELMRIQKNHQ
ncbi:MAG: hypothetical protein ACK46Y_01410 [Fluviicola sp.]